MFSATNNKTWNSNWPQKCQDALVPVSNIPKSSAFRCRVMGVFSALWMPFLSLSPSGSGLPLQAHRRLPAAVSGVTSRHDNIPRGMNAASCLSLPSLGISPSQRSLDSADFLGTELEGVSQASLQLGVDNTTQMAESKEELKTLLMKEEKGERGEW